MLDIRYVPGIHIFLFALTLYYYSYFIISMSLYLPFIPEHLISTYPINILTHSYKKLTYYSHIYLHTILSLFHSIIIPSIPPSSTLFIYYLTYLSLSFILSPLIYHSQFYHILFTIYTITILLPHNISFYTFQDKKKKIYLSYILLVYTIELYYSILFYLFSFIYYTYLYSYSYYIHHLLTIPPLYPILLYTHRHIDRHTQIHIDRHIVKFNSL